MPILENPKHERFVHYYLRHLSKARAAIEAGFSAKTARQIGHAISTRPEVAERIRELQAEQWKTLQMENDEILGRLAATARQDIRRLYNDDGTFKPIHELTFEEASMIIGLEQEVSTVKRKKGDGNEPTPLTTTRKLKFRDPVPALRILAQHRKLIGNEADEALNNLAAAFADRMAAARERRRKSNAE